MLHWTNMDCLVCSMWARQICIEVSDGDLALLAVKQRKRRTRSHFQRWRLHSFSQLTGYLLIWCCFVFPPEEPISCILFHLSRSGTLGTSDFPTFAMLLNIFLCTFEAQMMLTVHDDHLFDESLATWTLYPFCLRHFEFIQMRSGVRQDKQTILLIQSSLNFFNFFLLSPLQSDSENHVSFVFFASFSFFHLLICDHTCDLAFSFFFKSDGD